MQVLQAVFNFFCEILLGCRHEHLTRPFTIQKQTYKVCLDCGRQFFYSAETMRPLSARQARRARAAYAGELVLVPAHASVGAISIKSKSKVVA